MKTKTMITARALMLRLAVLPALATLSMTAARADGEFRCVPDVVGQFNALTERPDPLGFYIGDSPNPTACKHYQGMVRVEGADGRPYFIVSRSGVLPPVPGPDDFLCGDIGTEDDQPGNLLIVRMGSRDKNGERLRSNRLRRDTNLTDTPPDPLDTTVAWFSFDGEGDFPNYGHPGGMQVVGNILALAVEAPYTSGDPVARFQFIDVSDPEFPEIRSTFDPPEELGVLAGMVGITPLANGRYLMVVTGGINTKLWFFESLATDGTRDGVTDLGAGSLSWVLRDEWKPQIKFGEPGYPPLPPGTDLPPGIVPPPINTEDGIYLEQDWPNSLGEAHQTLQFLREGDINGTLYLAGARGVVPFGEDRMDLYRVDFIGDEIRLKLISSRHKNSHPNADGVTIDPRNNTASFAAASTFYVSPSGELIFYATEHENDGPIDGLGGIVSGNGSVKAGEWRHIDMVRPDSPTLLPSLELFPPYEVLEGGDTLLTGFARPPVARPWIQLFTDPHFGGRYVVVDFADWDNDSFDDFRDLDGSPFDAHFGFDNEPSSWRWFAPVGGTLRANDDDFGDGDFPGEHTRTLSGTGQPETGDGFGPDVESLSQIANDAGTGSMNDELTSVEFFPDCGDYYSATMNVRWDRDLNGSYEADGFIVPFDAAALDGPDNVSVPVMAQHPIDGLATFDVAVVQVINVAPSVGSFGLFDSFGLEVGVDVPFALLNLEYTAEGTFADPGRPDHQTAALDWGDGIVEQSTGFDLFTDAFGGVTGQFRHHHAFTASGALTLRVQVLDDDGGQGDATLPVQVLSPGEALQWLLQQIDALLAAATQPGVIEALLEARANLDGHNGGAALDGALDRLAGNDPLAAIVQLEAFVASLTAAEAAGAGDLSGYKYLAAMVAESVAQAEYLRVVAALPSPTPGQALRIQLIRQAILDGHLRLAAGDYAGAFDRYKDAAARAGK
jgi:hypothetical protein